MKTSFFPTLAGSCLVPAISSPLLAQPSLPSGDAPVKYRVVSYLSQYSQPVGLTESTPGVFYAWAGSNHDLVFTITPQGTITPMASFAVGEFINSLFVTGPDG